MKNIVYENQIAVQQLPGRDLKWLFTPEMQVSESFSMNVVTIKSGCTVKPAHSHPAREELIYVTSGEGEVYLDGEVYRVHTGTAILFPCGSIHMLRNTGLADMKVICVFVPQATLADYEYHNEIEFPETNSNHKK